jgi:hypothetical protein
MLVKLIKLRAAPNAVSEPGSWDTYVPGSLLNSSSLPVDYELVGRLVQAPAVGRCVRVLRISRNGVKQLGVFQSTEVIKVCGDTFETPNSIYRIIPVGDGGKYVPIITPRKHSKKEQQYAKENEENHESDRSENTAADG